MARVVGLGHIGLYVRDLDRMTAFYRDLLGMQVTKQRPGVMAFLSSDPKASDHEIALVKGRPENDNPHLINQISLRVASLADLRDLHRRLKADGYRVDRVVNHGSAIGCYFYDPEDNVTEIFWVTGHDNWMPTSEPVDLESTSDADLLAHVERIIDRERDVPLGTIREPAASPA